VWKKLQRRRIFRWLRLQRPGSSARMVRFPQIMATDEIVVSAPIVGLNSEERIKEMVEAVSIELSKEEIKYLEEPYMTRSIKGHS
jgi:hypothetical protein